MQPGVAGLSVRVACCVLTAVHELHVVHPLWMQGVVRCGAGRGGPAVLFEAQPVLHAAVCPAALPVDLTHAEDECAA